MMEYYLRFLGKDQPVCLRNWWMSGPSIMLTDGTFVVGNPREIGLTGRKVVDTYGGYTGTEVLFRKRSTKVDRSAAMLLAMCQK